jgi:hypothetical protein
MYLSDFEQFHRYRATTALGNYSESIDRWNSNTFSVFSSISQISAVPHLEYKAQYAYN